MKNLTFLFFFVFAVLCGCRAQEPEHDDGSVISAKCAAVLLASTSTLGAGVAYTLTPAALCTAGFCAPGVAGSSFASWWQSTIPLVVKGSLFAQLQATAMGGVGLSFTAASATVGGVVGATYLRDVCTFVDETDPESGMGLVFDTSLTVVNTAIETKEKMQMQCASSTTCTAVSEAGTTTVETISSMWDSFTTAASTVATRTYLRYEILKLESKIATQKDELGVHLFDFMSKFELTWANAELANMHIDIFEKIHALEAQIMEKEHLQYEIRKIERKVQTQKDEFGAYVFDYMRKFELTWANRYLANTYNDSIEKIRALEAQIMEKESKI